MPDPNPAPSPSPSPTPAAFVNADGTLGKDWLQHEKIPAEVRTSKTLAAIADVPAMASQLFNLEKALGKKRAVVPTDPENKAEIDEYFALAGWPKEGPDKYPTIPLPEGVTKDDPETTKAWRAMCHKVRLTSEQMLALSKEVQAYELAGVKLREAEAVAANEAARVGLKNEWQGKYDVNVQLANTAAAAFADENDLKYAREAGWLEDPTFLKIMNKVGSAVSPDRLHANSSGGIDTGSVRRQIEELETSDAYRKSDNPRHNAVTAQVLQLREQLLAAR